tara:strand:+ start:22709 stop:23773 length:1065 start_codon:yes stop_codon:yes gene_type:complete
MIKINQIIFFGISYRVLIYIILISYPFFHSSFGNISPLTHQGFADFKFYLCFGESNEIIKNKYGDCVFNLNQILNNYKNVLFFNFTEIDNRYPGPIYPFLIFITNYSENNVLLFSLMIFSFECIAYIFWARYFYFNHNKITSFLFSFMPIPLYFGFFHSSDVVFYFAFTLLYMHIKKFNDKFTYGILLAFLTFLRPASFIFIFSILLFLLGKKKKTYYKITLTFLFISLFYYAPYFFYETSNANYENFIELEQFGYLINKIIQTLFNIPLLMGFIPSDSGNFYFYMLRCACGTIFLIGFMNLLFSREKSLDFIICILLVIFTAIFFFPAYRYLLPITPILFLYFSKIFLRKKIN